jgi:hypothetical protein
MTRIADLLDRDFSRPVEEIVKVDNDDPDTVFTELTEYIATDRIKAEYESLFSAMAAAPKAPTKALESGFPASSAQANLPLRKISDTFWRTVKYLASPPVLFS